MALLYPNIENIKKLHQAPTEGELTLINFLSKNLNDDYEIFFQPFINGDIPDIILIKKNHGIIIFEVKDWNINNYKIDNRANWKLTSNDALIKSPLDQVNYYKENLFNLHIEGLLENKIKKPIIENIIHCAVYFNNETKSTIENFLLSKFKDEHFEEQNPLYRNKVNSISILGKDSLNESDLTLLIQKCKFELNTCLFTEEIYLKLKRFLQPPFHQIEDGIEIKYSKEQNVFLKSEIRPRRKIKGVAGCGKTLVLAKRAVNAHKRTKDTVLILTYNHSLKNYIHDRINDVREEFSWNNFYITNYHQFIKTQANNFSLVVNSLIPFNDPDFFKPVKNKILPYKSVFIDEVQDYKTEWLETITKYFMTEETEFLVFGDEKQNIYDRPLDENKEPIIRTIPGQFNKSLNSSKRFSINICRIAVMFQKEFFNIKYSIDDTKLLQNPELDNLTQSLEYYHFNFETTPDVLFNNYLKIIRKLNVHPSDIGILSAKVDYLRELDYLIRTKLKEKTETTFETKEYFDFIREQNPNETNISRNLKKIRDYKKNHFWMKTGTTKLSTTHSFKGWEIPTLFLIIENEDQVNRRFTSDELVYTGLTRARFNLIVFNIGNERYHNFFSQNIGSI